MPNKPSTPIRSLINNMYGSFAEVSQNHKNKSILTIKKQLKHKEAPRGHTRASSSATEFRSKQYKTQTEEPNESQQKMFKMQRFLNVKSKVNEFHTN